MKKILAVIVLVIGGSFAFAQKPCSFKYGANEADSLKCLEQITNFRTFYNAKNYNDAYESWQYVIQNCPCSWDGIYTNAQTLFQNLIKDEKDSARREVLIDSLMYTFDVRSTYFPEKFTVGSGLGFKAYNTMRYRKSQYEQAYTWFVQSVEMEKENTQPAIWDTYFQLAENMTKAKKDTSIVVEAYERATDYLDLSILNATKAYEQSADALEALNAQLEKGEIDRMAYDKQAKKLTADTTRQAKLIVNYRKTLVKINNAVTPYASCEVLDMLYTKKFEDIKNDLAAVSKMVNTMFKGNCTDSPVFLEGLSILHKASPNRNTAYMMGNLTFKNYTKSQSAEDIAATIDYFKEAVKLSETHEQQADANYMLALAYRMKGSFSESRSAAYDALKARPNMGKAYILIGDLYANSGGRCGDEQVPGAYAWAAADKYAKAASVDPSCADEANSKRAKLRFPSKEELFKRGINSGSSYHVGCWIQENTTVR
jgi:tetratricopeptide (TPR) repeat protein